MLFLEYGGIIMKKTANQRIVESNFFLLEKAVASTAREEVGGLALIKKAVKELRVYLPNAERCIQEYFVFGCTLIGNKQYVYSKSNVNNKGLKKTAASIDWFHI